MNNGIQYFNTYWKDLKTPSNEVTVKIVQLIHKIIVEGGPHRSKKVLVHCHAGQGRTAIIIGAYLLYSGIATTGVEAVSLSKKGRPKLFSNSYNTKFVHNFATFLKE